MNRKPVGQITDRAKRYRANQDIPEGPRGCGFCGAKRDLGVDHIDGYEEHGEPENLLWLCRSCNQLKAAVFKAQGIGRATDQYNPFRGLFRGIFGEGGILGGRTYRYDVAQERRRVEEQAERRRERGQAREAKRAAREAAAEKRAHEIRSAAKYKGVTIYKRGDGSFFTSLDPDSEFESIRDARAVIDHFRNPATSLRDWERSVSVLRGETPGSARQAARVVRSTPPGRRLVFLGRSLKNPGAKSMGQFVAALQIAKGEAPGDSKSAAQLIRDTPKARIREFQRQVWAIRKERYGPSGRLQFGDDVVPF